MIARPPPLNSPRVRLLIGVGFPLLVIAVIAALTLNRSTRSRWTIGLGLAAAGVTVLIAYLGRCRTRGRWYK
jgi:uncharacterized membrane protein